MRGEVFGTVFMAMAGTALLALPVLAQGVDESLTVHHAGAAAVAPAEGLDRVPTAPDNFGTQDGIDLWIPASSFAPRDAGAEWDYAANGYYQRTTGSSGQWEADVPLVNGAFMSGYRVYFYDSDAASDLTVLFFKRDYDYDTQTASTTTIDTFDSGDGADSGYQDLYRDVSQTIDLRDGTMDRYYGFVVDIPENNANLMFGGIRVFWFRQVSPAPATATFNDVPPSHPYFQFIEALAASGITAGCGNGDYCPDNLLTRGQMAVFLSRALGLHWSQ